MGTVSVSYGLNVLYNTLVLHKYATAAATFNPKIKFNKLVVNMDGTVSPASNTGMCLGVARPQLMLVTRNSPRILRLQNANAVLQSARTRRPVVWTFQGGRSIATAYHPSRTYKHYNYFHAVVVTRHTHNPTMAVYDEREFYDYVDPQDRCHYGLGVTLAAFNEGNTVRISGGPNPAGSNRALRATKARSWTVHPDGLIQTQVICACLSAFVEWCDCRLATVVILPSSWVVL